ncbi:hypothetical protein [Sunxiuqinia elliptica]|uniref:Four helix bundle protein n=1 Tax=Sunxiuqinia elliptica TaxID=655355 RepID=A0A1I2K3I3_9BACT|nr:hypothetical protein [Sunxiuqinia elliptica]SFF59757.1 hypothetical protein SAMN05216283_11078 [Sunxiuqinia elliptica]
MQKTKSRNIEEATQRVRDRIPLEELRHTAKYNDLSPENYKRLIKSAETIALLILSAYISKK